jgi:hypothetical protein
MIKFERFQFKINHSNMKIKLYSFLALFILGGQLLVQAQAPAAPQNEPKPTTEEPTKRKAGTNGIGFGLMFGTDGAGISLGKCISKNGKMYVQVAGTYAPIVLSNIPYAFSGQNVIIDADIKLGSISAVFEYHPFGNAFKLSAGAAYMLTNITANAILKDSTKQGDIMISPNELGDIQFGVSTNPICPYVGIGFGRSVPKHRVGFNFEFGAYYIEKPVLSFKTTGMLEPTSSQEGLLKNNLSGFTWLPNLRMGLIFKLGKLK